MQPMPIRLPWFLLSQKRIDNLYSPQIVAEQQVFLVARDAAPFATANAACMH